MLIAEATTDAGIPAVSEIERRERREHLRHLVAVTASIVMIVASLAGWAAGPAVAVVIVIAAVIVGLPHGALDVVIGPAIAPRSVFFGSYLAFAAAVLVAWLFAPLLSLSVFFLASWFHFARGDAEHHHQIGGAGPLLGISTAGCAIGLPLALHSGTVAPLFSDLLLGTATLTTKQVAALGVGIAYPSIAAGVVACVAAIQTRHSSAVVELMVIALLAALAHPLVSFALYFALWHSPRHLIAQDVDASAVKPTLAATIATLVTAALVWRFAEPSMQVATQVVFIGLAALTGPHLVVTELLASRNRRARSAASRATSAGMVVRNGLQSPQASSGYTAIG